MPSSRLIKPCLYCGTDYKVQCPARLERSKFCSHACRQRWRFDNGEWTMEKMVKPKGIKDNHKSRICETCSVEYIPTGQNQRWCRVCSPDFNWSRRIFRYGVTKPMWDAMLETQDGTCALCSGKAIHVDHCHNTGRVRGLLCYSCNLKLAGLDDIEWRVKAEAYRVSV